MKVLGIILVFIVLSPFVLLAGLLVAEQALSSNPRAIYCDTSTSDALAKWSNEDGRLLPDSYWTMRQIELDRCK